MESAAACTGSLNCVQARYQYSSDSGLKGVRTRAWLSQPVMEPVRKKRLPVGSKGRPKPGIESVVTEARAMPAESQLHSRSAPARQALRLVNRSVTAASPGKRWNCG